MRRRNPARHIVSPQIASDAAMQKTTPTDVLVSAAAGVIATVPMTMAMEGLHRVMPGEHDGPLPPREVTQGLYEHWGAAEHADERDLQKATFFLHYAFGGAAGALFPLVAPTRLPAAVGAGVLYALTVWSGSYLGILPAMGVRHDATRDSVGRTAMMVASHVVWGATLGLLLRGRPGLRTASRNPDAPEF
jgi:putative membrane protein